MASVGFYSCFSILYPSAFPVVDTHPDPATISDLRLLDPWPELRAYARKKTEDLNAMDDHGHGHVPWLLLILHYLDEWQSSHGGKLPSNYKDKTEFRKFILDSARMNSTSGVEENYEQAAAAVLKNLNENKPSSAVREIWEAPECKIISEKVR
jgi:NEDD8-activating enzyme E1 regulatory subunit